MVKCPNCGQENSQGSTFCAFCGYKFTDTPSPAPGSGTPSPGAGSQGPAAGGAPSGAAPGAPGGGAPGGGAPGGMGGAPSSPGTPGAPAGSPQAPAGMPPSTPPPTAPAGPSPEQQVQAPAIALMILGGVNALQALLFAVVGVVGIFDPSVFAESAAASGNDPMLNVMVAIGMGLLMGGASALIFFGGLRMKNLESFGLSMAAAIAAVVPCVTIYCCLPGIGLGIWALIVLNRPEVKSSFR